MSVEIKKFYQTVLPNGSTAIVFNAKTVIDENAVVEEKNLNTHYIHVIDTSGSMYRSLGKLKEDLVSSYKLLKEGDTISLIEFSSTSSVLIDNELIKGYDSYIKIHKNTEKLSAGGTTCFENAIRNLVTTVNKSKNIDLTHVILFTDGESVTYKPDKDYKNSIDMVENIADIITSLNTIGYGYYNADFLKEISSKTQFGRLTHSEEITDFIKIFKGIKEDYKDLTTNKIAIKSEGIKTTLYTTLKEMNMFETDYFGINEDKIKNQFVCIVEDGVKEVKLEVNGVEYKLELDKDLSKLPSSTRNNILYAMAYDSYYNGDSVNAIECIVELGDRHFANKVRKAFTTKEKQEVMNELKDAWINNPSRFKDGKLTELEIKQTLDKTPFTVLDLLNTLYLDKNFYVPTKNYKRTGVKSEDIHNVFSYLENPTISDRMKRFALVLGKDNFNVGTRFKINGKVRLNKRELTLVGLDMNTLLEEAKDVKEINKVSNSVVIDSFRYAVHNIIQDGVLNIPEIEVVLCENTLNKLKEIEKEKGITFVYKQDNDEDLSLYKLNLTLLPMSNMYSMQNTLSFESVFDKTIEEFNLSLENTIINYYIKQCREKNASILKEGAFKSLTKDTITALNKYGINYDLSYSGFSTPLKEDTNMDEIETYEIKTIDISIKGSSSKPSMKTVLDGKASKNKNVLYMRDLVKELEDKGLTTSFTKETYKLLTDRGDDIIRERAKLNMDLKEIKMFKALNGAWWNDLTTVDNADDTYYTYEKDGIEMKIVPEYVTMKRTK